MEYQDILETGAWMGRQQAFAVIATKCSAARALSLKQMKESRSFEKLGLSWDEFCVQRAGISRVYADTLIRQLNEFGEDYFHLSEIARISPETYRRIAPRIEDESVEIAGEKFALIPDNASRIRAAIQRLRAQVRHTRAVSAMRSPGIIQLKAQADALLDGVSGMITPEINAGDRAALQGLSAYLLSRWSKLMRELKLNA